jgi:hypothetical protein
MRYRNQKEVVALGFIALSAAVVLLIRVGLKEYRRRLVRDDAIKKLRASGEFFAASAPD